MVFGGLQFVLEGFNLREKAAVKELILQNGGTVGFSISKTTKYLVVADSGFCQRYNVRTNHNADGAFPSRSSDPTHGCRARGQRLLGFLLSLENLLMNATNA